jgi:metallo-beta-lactamase class B
LFLAGVQTIAQTAQAPSREGPLHGQEPVKPFRIIGNIYYVGLSNNTSFLITTPQGHILLDPTFESAIPQIRKNIEQLGFKVRDIKILLNAHAHADHVEGLAAMKKLTGAKVLVMDGDAPVLADGGVSDFRSDGRRLWTPVRADQILHDGEQVRLGKVTMVAHRTAGHTKGCTTWTTVAEEDGRKYNIVFVCSLGLNRGVPLISNEKYPAIAEEYYKSFQLLKSLPCDVFLASHAAFFGLSEKLKLREQGKSPNPFIDPQGYRSYIEGAYKAYQEQL